MKKSGQTHTLFHSWGASKPLTDAYGQPPSSNTAQLGVGGIADPAAGLDLCDEGEDDELIHALAMSEMESKVSQQRASPTALGIQNDSNARSQTDFPMPKHDLPGFSNFSGRMLTYPTNYPVRDYQLNIVQSAIYKNTLVCLPTGLGKTFIAAVVMYNYFMWYPSGKIVFMAPTKPLVAQQIEACYNIMGIPQTDTAEMTGAMSPVERVKAWQTKRLFFLTPQIVMNDLSRGALPADQIKCLVVDEAHKAQGNHAYCQVVREILKYSKNFRVLALSATPGSDIKSVQQVITNLCITNIELRTEDSLDIKQYSHERQVDKIVVKLDEAVLAVKQKYMRILKMVVERLIRMRVIYNRDPDSLSKFILLKNRDAFRQNPPESLPKSQFGIVEGDFALCISLYHGYDLLQLHGLKPLYSFLEGLASGEKGFSRSRHELLRNADFCAILDELKAKFYPSNMSMSSISTQSESGKPFITGHPKLEKLQEIVLEHHQKYLEEYGNSNTRIMIFSQYRDSVMEITDMLNQHQPLVKVMNFIGQSSTGKSSKGFTQKEQLKVMRQFREGGYNTLVSTCVGEEGLDIGDVDLIICFDAHKSPIRLVQRMGRTGRKRKGRIVMLVTEGKEEMTYKKSLYSKKCIHNAILNSQRSLQFYPNYPQMIPEGHRPALFKTYITIAKSFQSKCSIKQMQNRPAISSNSGGLGHKCGQDGLLSKDEWDDYMEKYYVPEASIPIVEKPIITCLTSTDEKAFVSDDRPVLSLSEWLPWQNVRQETVHVSHSVRTAHLVEIMEFIDLQSTLGEDAGGIAYGVEMSAYLEEEENLLKSEGTNIKSNGILNFLAADKENKDALEKIRRRRIKHASLPQFSSPEEDLDTDEELPEFGVLCRKKNKTMSHQFKTDAALKLEGEDTSLGLPNKTSKTRREGCFGHLIGLDTEADSNRKDMCLTSLGNPKRKNTDKQGCLVDDVGKTSTDSDGHQNALRGETNSTCDIGTTVTDEPVFHAPLSHVAVERAKLGNEQLAVVTKSAGVCGVGVKQALMTSVSGSVKKDRNSKKKCSVQTSLFCDDSDEFEVDSGGKWPTSAVTMCREKGAMVEKVLDGASCVDEICELETDHEQGDIGKISVHGKMSDSETEFSQLPRLSQSTELPRLKHPRASGLGVCQPPCPGGLDIVFDELGTRDRLSPVDILELVDIWEAEKASTDGKLGAIAKNVPHVDYNGNLPKHVRTNRKIKMSVSSDAIKLNPADEMFEELPSLDEFFLGGDTDRSRCDTVAADHKITGEEKFTGELGCNSDRLFSTSNHVNVKWRESTDFRPGVHGLSGHGTGTNEIPMRSCSQSPADNDKLSVFSDSVSEDFDHLNNQCENHAPPEVIRCEESQKFYPGGFAETEFLSDVDTKDNFDSCLVRGSVDRSCGRDYKSSLNDKVCAGKKEMLVFQNCQGEKPSSYKVSAPGTSAHMSEVAVSHDTLQRKGVKEGTAEELAYEFKSPISSSVHRERKDNSFSKRKAIVSPVTNFQEAFNVSCSLFDEDFASDSSIHDANAIIHSDAHDKPFACYEDEAAFGTADVGKRNRDDEFITEASFGETKCPVVAVTTNQRANITASLLDEDDDDDDQLLAAMCVAASMQASESLCHQEVAAENINSTVSSELIRCNTKVTESKYVGPANPENTQVTFTQAVDSVLGSSESPEDFDTCAIQLDEPLSRSHQIDHCAKNTTHSLSDSVVHDASVKITNNISSLSSQTTNQQGRNFQENDGPCSPNLSSDELSPSILTNKTRRENVSNHRNSSTPILIKRKICFEDEAGDGVQEAVYDSYNKDADLLRDEIEPQVDGKDTQRSCGFTYSPPRTDLQTSGNPRSQVKMKNRAVFDNSLGHLTPVLPVPKRKKARLILSESSSDEDFEVNVKSKKKDATTSLSTTKKSVKRKKHQAAATAFIEVEAVLSDESVDSGDEDEDDLDCYDASFVNDDTHMSQSVAQDSFDVQAMYMRSTTNSDFPAALGRFKLQFDRKIEMDVFSQVPEEEESCYSEMDSFINDDLDEDCGVESAAEITICDNKGKKSASVIKPNTRTTCVAKRRKRIRILDSSGSDEHILSPEPPAKCLGTNTGHSDNLRMLAPAASGHLNTVTEKRSGILTSSVQGNLGSPKVLAPCALGKSVHGYLSSDASGHARTLIPSGMVSSRAVVPIAKGSRTPRTTVSSTSGNCGFSVPVSASGKPKFSLPTTSGNDATSRNFRTSAPSATDTPRSSTLGCLGKPRISEPQNSAVIGSSVEDTGSTSSNCTDVKSVRSFNFKKTANSSRISTPLAQAAGLVTPDVYLLDINANDDFVFGDCEPCPKGQVTTTHNANLPPRFSTKSSEKIAPNAKIHPSYSSEPTNKIASNASHISTHVKQVTKATNMSSVPNNASVQDQLHTEPLRRQDKFEKSQSWKAENKEQREKLNEIRCKGISDVKDTSSCTEGKGMSNSQVIVIPASSSSLCGQFQSSQSDDKSKLMILIDSRELSGAQELMSTLRLMHKQNAVVCQLSGCNYAVSSRMGVERKTISDFVNGAKKSKLVDRIRHLCDLYDRPVLIIEKDRIKPGELPSKKTFFRSKYVENMLASLSQSHIKVLYSESQEETANLLSKLCLQESKKNMSVSKSPTWANHANEQVMKFYLSMPNMNYPVALNLFHNYKTIAAFLHSPVELMQTKGCMSKARAMELHRFIRHEFDSQMLPNTTDK